MKYSVRKIGKSSSGVSVITVLTSPFPEYTNDGEKVKHVEEVTYLGAKMNREGKIGKEIGKRISAAMLTLKKMDACLIPCKGIRI